MSQLQEELTKTHTIQTGAMSTMYGSPLYEVPPVKRKAVLSNVPLSMILLAVDSVLMLLALSAALLVRNNVLIFMYPLFLKAMPEYRLGSMWVILSVTTLSIFFEGLYLKRLPFWVETKSLVKAISFAFLLVLAVVSLGQLNESVSRSFLAIGYLFSVFLLPLGRYLVKKVLCKVKFLKKPVLIIGSGKTGQMVAGNIENEKYLGYEVAGFLDNSATRQSKKVRTIANNYPLLGKPGDADRAMNLTGARHIIVAAPDMPGRELVDLVNTLQLKADTVTIVPDLLGIPAMDISIDKSMDSRMVALQVRNNLASRINLITKRLFDLIIGPVIFFALLPLMGILVIAIRLDSPGPALFSQRRIGLNKSEYSCYKFRTMHENNEEILRQHLKNDSEARAEWEKFAKLKKHDPRVTRVGQIIRKFSLDELPQLVNVLKGEMSIVGPRPYLPREKNLLDNYASTILKSRPGITGLWQVSGRSDIDFQGRLSLESWYVRNWSVWLDVTILFRTVSVVVARKGAY
jgi:undecaprenyl-phosphate galactose phosphotransferase